MSRKRNPNISPEEGEFIRAHIRGTSYKGMTELLNERFGTARDRESVRVWCIRHRLRNGLSSGKPRIWHPEYDAVLRESAGKLTARQMAEKLNGMFGTRFSRIQLTSHLSKVGVQPAVGTPRTRGSCSGRWGRKPKPVGTVMKRKDGYWMRKTAEPDVWRAEHKVRWEEANGPVPDGMVLVFADADKDNTAPENMRLMTAGALAILNNKYGLTKDAPELNELAIAAAVLESKLKGRMKK